jgi:hypothetical protein
MLNLLKKEINLSFLINPFYIFCASFGLAFIVYFFSWSRIFPPVSPGMIIFFFLSFILFTVTGKFLHYMVHPEMPQLSQVKLHDHMNDIMFFVIITMGIMNVVLMGYIPVFNKSADYLKFGIPVLDPLFNSLSIFFSVFYVQSYLERRKKRYLLYILIIVVFQLLIFRRSAAVWIITSSVFVYFLCRQNIRLLYLFILILILPLISFSFGHYGASRSDLSKPYILNDLGASDRFISSGIDHNHYLTYLYLASPVANLQRNVDEGRGFLNDRNFKEFFFYCIVPYSITSRLEKSLGLSSPEPYLIHPHLIAGTFLMLSYVTIGWAGMITMLIFLLFILLVCLIIIRNLTLFRNTTLSLLATTVSLLIFSNFLNRLDVILMLFIYPVIFHLIYRRLEKSDHSEFGKRCA